MIVSSLDVMKTRIVPWVRRASGLGGMLAVIGVGSFAAKVAVAQQTSLASRSGGAASVTVDTGALAFRSPSAVHYAIPGLCREAALTTALLATRTLTTRAEMAEVVRRDPAHDTLPASVAAIARSCGQQFTVANTTVTDLPDLFDLALLEQRDTLAQAVLAKQAALASSDSARARILLNGVTRFLDAQPPRVASATTITAHLDAMGPRVLSARIDAHRQLLDFATRSSDPRMVHREAAQVIDVIRPLRGTALLEAQHQLIAAYRALMTLAFLTTPDSMPALATQAQADLSRASVPGGEHNPFVGAKPDSVIHALLPMGNWEQLGKPTPPLHADFWFPPNGPTRDTLQPISGRPSLLVSVALSCYTNDQAILVYDECQRNFETIRRWRDQYGAAGLAITIVIGTSGHSLLSGVQTPAAEAANLEWYVHQYLRLPVLVAVQTIPFGPALPQPDGRFVQADGETLARAPDPFAAVYHTQSGPLGLSVVLTGRHGEELYAGNPSPIFEMLLAREMGGVASIKSIP